MRKFLNAIQDRLLKQEYAAAEESGALAEPEVGAAGMPQVKASGASVFSVRTALRSRARPN